MDLKLKKDFIKLWNTYFDSAELPIAFYYTDEKRDAELVKPGSVPRCVIAALSLVRKGTALSFNAESIGCLGGRKYLGFSEKIRDDLEYFLSCGIPGKVEGERYKKTPQIAAQAVMNAPVFKAPSRFIVFKRWDMLEKCDEPEVVVFFAKADVLSGLFTLANFDEVEPCAVLAPFGSGCSSIVQNPYLEIESNHPKAILGLFDVSARPFLPEDVLSLSIPMVKFVKMLENMKESFLITNFWKKLQKRIKGDHRQRGRASSAC